jgi:hypothetical protein
MAASLALHELLSAAIDLADRAGEASKPTILDTGTLHDPSQHVLTRLTICLQIIRSVAREGQLHAVEKAKGASSESNPAKFEDPQTIADRR